MILDNPEIVECPVCKAQQYLTVITSGNGFGALYYTDGRIDAPMFFQPSFIAHCPQCGAFYKITKETVVGQADTDIPEDKPYIAKTKIDGYLGAISQGLANTGKTGSKEYEDDMFSMRYALWHAYNDKISLSDDDPWKNVNRAAYEDNCRELLRLIEGGATDKDCLTRAELFRNLGQCEECARELGKIAEPGKYEACIAAISEACENKNTITALIRMPRREDEEDDDAE